MKRFMIPEGMKDFVIEECVEKRECREKLQKVFNSWGYEEIMTPSIEFYSTFSSVKENLKEEDMYKFFDNKGRILVLRPDMTIPIARAVATRYKDANIPLKFHYGAEIFRVHEGFTGKRNEYMDCGIERIGESSIQCDVETLIVALDALEAVSDSTFTLELGNINIFKKAIEALNLKDDEKEQLSMFIDKKSLKSLKDLLDTLNLKAQQSEFFTQLPWLFGNVEILEKGKTLAFSDDIRKEIEYLETIYTALKELGYEEHITFDLGMVPSLNYYTGLIFRGYMEGIGFQALSGGRYDHLLGMFGNDMPAIGFSVKVDAIVDSKTIVKQKKKVCVISYGKGQLVEAMKLRNELKNKNEIVELKFDENRSEIEVNNNEY